MRENIRLTLCVVTYQSALKISHDYRDSRSIFIKAFLIPSVFTIGVNASLFKTELPLLNILDYETLQSFGLTEKRKTKTKTKKTNKQNFMSLRLFSKQEKVLYDIVE